MFESKVHSTNIMLYVLIHIFRSGSTSLSILVEINKILSTLHFITIIETNSTRSVTACSCINTTRNTFRFCSSDAWRQIKHYESADSTTGYWIFAGVGFVFRSHSCIKRHRARFLRKCITSSGKRCWRLYPEERTPFCDLQNVISWTIVISYSNTVYIVWTTT